MRLEVRISAAILSIRAAKTVIREFLRRYSQNIRPR